MTDWDTAARCDTQRYARYFWGMIDRGVYLPCSQFEALFVSAAHTEADIDATVAAARESLAEAAKARLTSPQEGYNGYRVSGLLS